MNFNLSGAGGGIAILAVLWGLFVTVFWLVVAWRAMRAHEEIAEALRSIGRNQRVETGGNAPQK